MDSFPGSTHNVQWGDHLVYKVAGKCFAILGREETGTASMSIKLDPKEFRDRTRRKGITQAPYLAKKMWIRIADISSVPQKELSGWIRQSYDMVCGGLSKSVRDSLASK
jgi:predicted DNA-binding protein (MmcQ/YjbR family)